MTQVLYGIVFTIVLGIYWMFIAPRLDRAPKWFRITFSVVGGALILALVLLVILGVWSKYF